MKSFQINYVIPMSGHVIVHGKDKEDALTKFMDYQFEEVKEFVKDTGEVYFCEDCDVIEVDIH
jgi:hypothetical protein